MISSPVVAGATAFAQDYNNLRIDVLNLSMFEAVVAPMNGDYSTVGAAITAGKKRIFVKIGTYSESAISSTMNDIYIVGEDRQNTIFQSTASGASSFALDLSGARITIKNMTIQGAAGPATETLVRSTDGYYESVTFKQMKYTAVDANSGIARFFNCFIDGFGKPSSGCLLQSTMLPSYLDHCVVRTPLSDPNSQPITNSSIQIQGCSFEGRVGIVSGTYITGCTFKFANLQLYGTTITGNSFDNNATDPGTYPMLSLQARNFIGNHVSCNYYTRKILKITMPSCVVNSNYFDNGKDIEIDSEDVSFCSNVWFSAYAPQTIAITLNKTANFCQVNHNILKGMMDTPLITDKGTNNNTKDNILHNI